MTLTNLDKLADATGVSPVVDVGESVTITVHASNAVYTAQGDTIPETARKLLDALGVE